MSTSVSIEQLVADIARDETTIARNPEDMDERVRPSLSIAKREAEDRLRAAVKVYAAYVENNSVAIFVTGDPECIKSFTGIARDLAGVIRFDADELYEILTERVEPSIGPSREFGVTQLRLLIHAVDDMLEQLGIKREARGVSQDDIPYVKDRAATTKHIRECVRRTFASELEVAFLAQKVVKIAREQRYKESVVPVAVVGASDGDKKALVPWFKKGATDLALTGEQTEESVTESLKTAQDRIKKRNEKRAKAA